jgi:hypothetical protein
MAFPDDLNYTEGERTTLLGDISDGVAELVRAAELTNENYSEVGRAAFLARIEALIDTTLPPAA